LDDLFHDLQLRGFQPTRAKTRRIPHTDILVLTIQDLDSIPSVSVVEGAAAGIVYHTDKLFQERVIEVGKKFIGERVQLSDTNCAQGLLDRMPSGFHDFFDVAILAFHNLSSVHLMNFNFAQKT
jgi:hypothetical protein